VRFDESKVVGREDASEEGFTAEERFPAELPEPFRTRSGRALFGAEKAL
jgi:hypothetical protein